MNVITDEMLERYRDMVDRVLCGPEKPIEEQLASALRQNKFLSRKLKRTRDKLDVLRKSHAGCRDHLGE